VAWHGIDGEAGGRRRRNSEQNGLELMMKIEKKEEQLKRRSV
jgi:hypothetical protein